MKVEVPPFVPVIVIKSPTSKLELPHVNCPADPEIATVAATEPSGDMPTPYVNLLYRVTAGIPVVESNGGKELILVTKT